MKKISFILLFACAFIITTDAVYASEKRIDSLDNTHA